MIAVAETKADEARLLADIAAAMRSGNIARASELADAALARGLNHPLPHQARAMYLDALGQGDDALESFLKARTLAPNDPMVANGVAICLGRMGRLDEAMAAFDAALALDPRLVTTHFHRGWICEMNKDFIAAGHAYRKAVDMAPQYAAAWTGLATSAEGVEDWKEARLAATHSLQIDPYQPRAVLSLALADFHDAAFAAVEARLRAALKIADFVSGLRRVRMLDLLAEALDRQDKTQDAFEVYTAANQARLANYVAPSPSLDMAALVRDLTAYFGRTYPQHWKLPAAPVSKTDMVREHVFLLGFPRSGTTLLEQVLATHPDIATLEESDVLDAIAEEFLLDAARLDRLAALEGSELSCVRERYWERVRSNDLVIERKIFVDKLPLNTIKLPLIAKLFPGAKVIFALRDPRDVVFSCFRRHLPVNASTYEFLSLQGTAQFYDSVMTLGEMCRERLPLAFHIHRHEDLVGDFEREILRLCAFVGVGWNDRFNDFAEIARRRSIRSISASQVRRRLYRDGLEQWRRYAPQMASVMPVLQTWIEKFGYESD